MLSGRLLLTRLVPLLLVLQLGLVSGCAWTGSLFGGGDDPEQAPAVAEATEPAAPAVQPPPAEPRDQGSLVPRPERRSPALTMGAPSELQRPEPATPPTTTPAAEAPAEPVAEPVAAPEPEQTVAALTPEPAPAPAPRPAEPEAPLPAKGQVPLQRPTGAVPSMYTGDVEYRTAKELHDAVQKAIAQDKFLGYTDPFDAFPVIDGADTISAAFIPVNYPNHKIFFHALYAPGQPYDRRVYGYTVIDMTTNQDYGHFDGNADGVFEQKTLDPKIVLDSYMQGSGSELMQQDLPPDASSGAAPAKPQGAQQ